MTPYLQGIAIQSDILYPNDFYSFTRRPLFLVIDSTESTLFRHICNTAPIVLLMSPSESIVPTAKGSLFTLFLSNPSIAFCMACNITSLSADQHKLMVAEMSKIESTWFFK